jgi:hypothetical protein
LTNKGPRSSQGFENSKTAADRQAYAQLVAQPHSMFTTTSGILNAGMRQQL